MMQLLKMSKRDLAAQLLSRSGLGAILRTVAPWHGVLTLAYHRIGADSRTLFDTDLWSATPESFDAQVRLLKKHFDIISPRDLRGVLRKGSGRYTLITFDDGYLDNYKAAFPILKAHNVPATFFVATSFMDSPRPSWYDEVAWMVRTSTRDRIIDKSWLPAPVYFDEPDRLEAVRSLLRVYKSLPGERTEAYLDFLAEATGSGRSTAAHTRVTWMTWDMLREMRAAGMSIGGHTVNHPILARLSREEQHKEIEVCKERLEAELGQPMTVFSYPDGTKESFNDDTCDLLGYSGVEFAFSYYGGFQRFHSWDPYDIPRVRVEMYTTPAMFKATLTLPRMFA
jgi:peptidoglycan/xylan/chitin deacetylase (PgdA/CDA1 family)